jgi:hypothetical protein
MQRNQKSNSTHLCLLQFFLILLQTSCPVWCLFNRCNLVIKRTYLVLNFF